ncbi:MAG TPA: hypothetical protein VLH16_07550 [Bacteroidales bacterium]|nr:hypothetical protein [Bacteroidales bacterium]
MNKRIVNIALAVVIIVLGFLVVESIMGPVRFKEYQEKREAMVVERLKLIRSAQLIHRTLYNSFVGDWDSLIYFMKNDHIPIVKMIPDLSNPDLPRTITDTIGFVKVADSVFKGVHFPVDSIPYIPFSGGERFEINAGRIERGGVTVNVFEARAHYSTFLKGLNEQLVRNMIGESEQLERYPGLFVGSMTEPSSDGNWE